MVRKPQTLPLAPGLHRLWTDLGSGNHHHTLTAKNMSLRLWPILINGSLVACLLRAWDLYCHSGRPATTAKTTSPCRNIRGKDGAGQSLFHFCLPSTASISWKCKGVFQVWALSFQPLAIRLSGWNGVEWSGPNWNICSTLLSCPVSSFRDFFPTKVEMTDGSPGATLSR